jgi:nucleoside-diphosphate-sugar epimerase
MKTVFINGGAGLIGAVVARKMAHSGHRVVVFDSFAHYISPLRIAIKNYIDLRFQGIEDEVIIERGDTTNAGHAKRILEKYQPEYVLHLAAVPLADLSNVHIEEAVNNIFLGTVNMLEAVSGMSQLRKFVYVSSSMAYGDFQSIPCPEDHPKRPKDIYGGCKYAGEIMTEVFGQRFNVPYTIVRPSAVYGPFDVNRRVSQIFIENALSGKPLRLHGGGKLAFDFTYVDDIADGLILALLKDEAIGEAFNITYGKSYSLYDFAIALKRLIPSVDIEIVDDVDQHRPIRGALSIEKARRVLGYDPKFPLERGLELYVNTYRELGIFSTI